MKNKNNALAIPVAGWFLTILAGPVSATTFDVDLGNSQNGIFDIYSATFDPPLNACGGGSPSYCSFFGGDPPASRALVITPNPTGVITGVPGGITGAPSASFMNLTLGSGNTQLTITGGALKFDQLVITISGSTVVTATGAGFVFDTAPQTTSVDANGQAVFLVNLAPSTAVDFSTFSEVVTSCTGPLCALIPILTLDMIRYRLVIDFDATFSSFTGSLIGQTANNSMVFANLNHLPEITVTESTPPADDEDVTFGTVTEGQTITETVTVTNDGAAPLLLGTIGSGDGLASPFALGAENCSNQTLTRGQDCTIQVSFNPTSSGSFTDSFAIPSNDGPGSDDGAEPIVTVAVTGTGTAAVVPYISITDSLDPGSDADLDFGSILGGTTDTATVTVRNRGTAALQVGEIGLVNALATPFSIADDNCSNVAVAAGGNCIVTIEFAPPLVPGSFTDSFDVPSNDPDTASLTVGARGIGLFPEPDIRITDATAPDDDLAFTFGNVRDGGSFDRTVTITNVGSLDLVIGTIGGTNGLAPPFSFVAGENECSGQTLTPSTSCTVRLRYEPTGLGAANDSMDVPSNDPDSPSLTVSMTGTGVEDPGSTAISPDGADSGFMALDVATLLLLGGAAAGYGWRRRRAS